MRRMSLYAVLSLLLASAAVGVTLAVTDETTVEVRVNAKRLVDGRTEFAVQSRTESGRWSERILPAGRFLPARPPVDRWLNSTPVDVPVPLAETVVTGGQTTIELSGQGDARRTFTLSEGDYLVILSGHDERSERYIGYVVNVDATLLDVNNEDQRYWLFEGSQSGRDLSLLSVGTSSTYTRLAPGTIMLTVDADDDQRWTLTFNRIP